MEKLNIIVLCGGKSVESDISIITGFQTYKALDNSCYNKNLVYIDENNVWWLCDDLNNINDIFTCKKKQITIEKNKRFLFEIKKRKLKALFEVDAVVMALHGGFGENGAIASLLEMSNIPYTSSNIYSSAVTLDKTFTKLILSGANLSVIDYKIIKKYDYFKNQSKIVEEIIDKLGLPCIIKPATLGSSIGIKVANTKEDLKQALNFGFDFDNKILVEKALQNFYELNIAVKSNNGEIILSEIEKPKKNNQILSFSDKYLQNSKCKIKVGSKTSNKGMASSSREIPAKIDLKLKQEIDNLAKTVYQLFDLKGIVRIDFLVQNDKVYINEINTIPGSLAFYLWNDLDFSILLKNEIDNAIKSNLQRLDLVTHFESNIFKN